MTREAATVIAIERIRAIGARAAQDRYDGGSLSGVPPDRELAAVLEALLAPPPALREAFEAGFRVCQDLTTKFGEYEGDSIDEEYAAWLAERNPR